jgi:hypothetical protein
VKRSLIPVSLAMAALLAVVLAVATPASALSCDGCTTAFAPLRDDVTSYATGATQQSFLTKVDLAEALLFPPNPAFPPSPCASAGVLRGLDQQVQAGAGRLLSVEGATAISGDIAVLLATPLFPPSPCLPPQPM